MLIGNKKIQEYFSGLVKNETLSHAYLFHGPEGVGKKFLAFKIAELLSGSIKTNPDLRIIDKGNEEIHIADIRDLKGFIYLTPFGKCKIAVINNAHNLGHDASNALLKILEEPPGKSVLFLVTHLPKMLLPTVLSRCQAWRFRPLKENEVLRYLIAEKGIKEEIASSAAKLSSGSLGLALGLAENFNNFQKNVNLLNKLLKADFKERFETAKKISANPDDLKKMTGDWFIYSASLPDKRHAKELLYLNSIVSKSQYNHRLALENFLANL
ncbi:MAG: hypothetical protein HYS78_00135 [Parcubacteria group bacterium]|nr:hypothetical protein [Parcubacteria group bacterium]